MTNEEVLNFIAKERMINSQYGTIEDDKVYEKVMELLEKQVPKKPINVIYDGQYIEYWNCPHCHIQHSNEITLFCDNCGQALI